MSNKENQRTRNPFPYSDSNKRYHTYDYYLRQTFGGKCAKIPLDTGCTCPNIDGSRGLGGCIYCSGRGSGDFAELPTLSIGEQYRKTREKLSSKWSTERCIPYFQAHTNTYAPLSSIREWCEEALRQEGVVGMNIATRADCLEEDVIAYLSDLSQRTRLTVELGLQTVHDETATRINRGHTYEEFVDGYTRLRRGAPHAEICVHLILGLPDESDDMMLETAKKVAELHPNQVKIHLLHVLKNTKMARLYLEKKYTPLTKEHYVSLVADCLEILPADIVIARLTGDGMGEDLLAPDWSRKKVSVINDIDKLLYERNTWQGILCK